MSKDEKIVLLERFLRAVVGRPEAKITYKGYEFNCPTISVECDIDNVVRIISDLNSSDIHPSFYPRGTIEKLPWEKRKVLEGTTDVEFFFEPLLWKENELLKKKIKELTEKKEIKQE